MTWLLNAGQAIANSPTWVLILLAFLFVLILIFIFFQIWRYGVRRAKLPQQDDPNNKLNYIAQNMRSSFRAAHKSMSEFFPGRNSRYANPVFLMIGPAGSGKTELLDASGLSTRLGQVTGDSPCDWQIFDRATVLDIRGDLVFEGSGPNKKNRSWNTLISLFQGFRPQRPLDGLIITLPAERLIRNNDFVYTEIAEMGQIIHRRIGELQSRLGMSLPIYIIITKSEAMTGFRETAALLPGSYHSDAFGWSSPYSPDATYAPEWCNEAISEMVQKIQDAVNEFLTLTPSSTGENREAILLPSVFEQLEKPLEVFLNAILRISNFNKSATLRGIYFTGSVQTHDPSPETQTSNAGNFANNLLGRKIFPEFALAYPFNLNLLSTNRRVRLAQICMFASIALSIFGLAHSWRYLDETTRMLSSAVSSISSSAEQLRLAHLDGVSALDLVSVKESLRVMNKLELMANADLTMFTLPTTWLANLPGQLVEILNLSYDRLLYKEMYLWLSARGEKLTKAEPETNTKFVYYSDTKAPIVLSKRADANIELADPDYAIVDDFLNTLSTFERMVGRYERIQPDQDTIALRTVAKYLYNIELTPKFIESVSPTLFGGRTNRVLPVNLNDLKIAARLKMEEVWENFLLNWISRDGLIIQLVDLSGAVDVQYDKESISQNDFQRLEKIRSTLEQIRKNLQSGRYDWLVKESADLPSEFESRLRKAESQKILGSGIREKLIAIFNQVRFEGRQRLIDFPMPVVGSVVVQKDNRLALADHLEKLYLKLEAAATKDRQSNLKISSKITGVDQDLPTSSPLGQHVKWDISILNSALADAEKYEELFQRQGQADNSETPMTAAVNRLTMHSLAKGIASQINTSITFRRTPNFSDMASKESALRDRVSNFAKAIEPLQGLFGILERTNSTKIYLNSSALAVSEAIEIVTVSNELLEEARPYSVDGRNYDEWDGVTPPLQQLLGIRNESQLPSYVDFQRERVAFLANQYVAPALDFLLDQNASRTGIAYEELGTWLSIIEDLNAYDNMQAKNPILELETFLLNYLTKIECGSIQPLPNNKLINTSWFGTRLIDLHVGMVDRCKSIQTASLATSYEVLSNKFNEVLAGKSPFSLGSFYGKSVSAQTIHTYLKEFNQFMNLGGGDPLMFLDDKNSRPMSNFITKMDKLSYAFDQASSGENTQDPHIWTLEPEFRINREYEAGGDQIIEWRLSSGNKTASLYQQGQRLTWSPGNEIKISFTWALNSDTRPARDRKRSDLSIDGRTATFTYPNEWALFSAINRNKASILETSKDERTNFHVLGFKVPIVSNPEKGSLEKPKSKGKAQLFLALRVYGSSAKGTKRLTIPYMPVKAPLFKLQ